MKRIFSYTITAQDSDQRIYDFLCHHGYSRHIRTWLKQHPGSVRLNDKEALFYFPLKTGDLLEITLEEEQPSENIIPVCLPLHIIYEDEDLMVIDKPADMPVHPSIGNYENTLANAVAWYFQQQNIPFVFRCINRLDRDTTGLLILAKNMLSGAILSDQMKNARFTVSILPSQRERPIPPVPSTVQSDAQIILWSYGRLILTKEIPPVLIICKNAGIRKPFTRQLFLFHRMVFLWCSCSWKPDVPIRSVCI